MRGEYAREMLTGYAKILRDLFNTHGRWRVRKLFGGVTYNIRNVARAEANTLPEEVQGVCICGVKFERAKRCQYCGGIPENVARVNLSIGKTCCIYANCGTADAREESDSNKWLVADRRELGRGHRADNKCFVDITVGEERRDDVHGAVGQNCVHGLLRGFCAHGSGVRCVWETRPDTFDRTRQEGWRCKFFVGHVGRIMIASNGPGSSYNLREETANCLCADTVN